MQFFDNIFSILIFINHIQCSRRSNLENDLSEDAFLDTHQLIAKYKYKAETHFVQTDDNYILRMHRIAKPNAQPFFLMHGLSDSSAAFVVTGPNHGLGYYLSDLGYDIWLGNARGNRYSRNHTKLNPDQDNIFWDFSWHEIGIYDLPAMIDYVLNFTKYNKLFYAGHSQGTTSFFVMCSKRPDYNNKIILMHALGPCAFMNNLRSQFKIYTNIFKTKFSENMPELLFPGPNFFIPSCKTFTKFCIEFLFLMMGPNPKQFNVTMLPIFLGHVPSSCSTKQFHHYVQLMMVKRFCEFDFGKKVNIKKYGKNLPPNYDISKITTPIVLYYSFNDYLTSYKDVEKLISVLPNVQNKYLIGKWNHIDFLWGIDAREIIYKKINEEIKKITST